MNNFKSDLAAQRYSWTLERVGESFKRMERAMGAYERLMANAAVRPELLRHSRTELESASRQLAKRASILQASLSELPETVTNQEWFITDEPL